MLTLALLALLPTASARAGGLGGSHASMLRQHAVAASEDLTFLKTAAQVRDFAAGDRLDSLTGNADYALANVSFPYARPAVKLFVERLARYYHIATGSQLVVTSLTRPTSLQPRNASPLSVHPAGMAVDFRVPADAAARAWLEQTLLGLEGQGVLDVTREHTPPHYHVAVFPDAYDAYAATRPALPAVPQTPAARAVVQQAQMSAPAVRLGETDATSAWLAGLAATLMLALMLGLGVRRSVSHASRRSLDAPRR